MLERQGRNPVYSADVVSHLNRCGVPIITGPGPRAGAIGTITSVYIRDPDQNLVEISNY